jgi:hypothetical protein
VRGCLQAREILRVPRYDRHRLDALSTSPVTDLVERLVDVGYDAYFLDANGSHPITEFDVERHQLDYLRSEFVPYSMPPGYVNNLLFVPRGN